MIIIQCVVPSGWMSIAALNRTICTHIGVHGDITSTWPSVDTKIVMIAPPAFRRSSERWLMSFGVSSLVERKEITLVSPIVLE
jgi:hypothetical protein